MIITKNVEITVDTDVARKMLVEEGLLVANKMTDEEIFVQVLIEDERHGELTYILEDKSEVSNAINASLFHDINEFHEEFVTLFREGRYTRRAMRELAGRLQDKYPLTEEEALKIVRRELSISEIANIFAKKK